jgi:hypothetical protein
MKNYLLIFLICCASVFGAGTITTDGAPTNWNDINSWDLGRLPIAGDDVVIATAGFDLDINETPALLSLKSSGAGTLTLNSSEVVNATTIQANGNASEDFILITGAGSPILNGNVQGHTTQTLSAGIEIVAASTATVTINGNVLAGTSFGIDSNGACTITINGNVTGSTAHGIDCNLTTTLTVTGSATGGSALAHHAIRMVTDDSTLTVGTVVYSDATTPPLKVNLTNGTLTITGFTVNGKSYKIYGGDRYDGGGRYGG